MAFVKSLRISFSAYSPAAIELTGTTRTSMLGQFKMSRQAHRRRSPKTSSPSTVTPTGCKRPSALMLAARRCQRR